MRRANAFNLARLREGLKPFRLHFFPTLRSTNDHAAALRKRGDLFAPAIVLAARQTAGRGRGANTWYSAPGSLTVTFVLAADESFAPHHLPLAAGFAARNAAAEIASCGDVQLKWPNDLVVPHPSKGGPPLRKLAGLLCERLDGVDLIGIGLNVNPPPRTPPKALRDRVIYLRELARDDEPLDLTDALITLARHLHETLVRQSETPFPLLLREYDRHHALIGRPVTILSPTDPPLTGKCAGLDDSGRLLLRNRAGLHRVIAGHVQLA